MCALCTVRGKRNHSCLFVFLFNLTRIQILLSETLKPLFFYFHQPFDEDYLNHLDPPVKHMSFHAYIRKLTGGADK